MASESTAPIDDESAIAEILVSPKFCDPNANLTVLSSDSMRFKVFSKDLAMFSGAFPPAEVTEPIANEVISLPEPASVLELLFQFMRHQRQPNLSATPFDTIGQLAEAVEKYDVFTASEVCRMHMTAAVPDHPVVVFAYATRHGFNDLSDLAAPNTVGQSLKTMQEALLPKFILPWLTYREQWLQALIKAHCSLTEKQHYTNVTKKETCSRWQPFTQQIQSDLGVKLEVLLKLVTLTYPIGMNRCCEGKYDHWLQKLKITVESIPNFSTFI